jgi:AcrR family transcriptional regulator
MARPQAITDEEVLAAARAVFSSRGISATVEEVAERCHVGVATIFRRFPTKQALFTAATNLVSDTEWSQFLAQQQRRRGVGHARAALTELAHTMLDAARKMMPLIMMKHANPSMVDREGATARATWMTRSLTEYFQGEIAAGHMIAVDPRVAARIWLGSLRHIVMIETLGSSLDGLSTAQFVEGLVDMFYKPAPKRKPR